MTLYYSSNDSSLWIGYLRTSWVSISVKSITVIRALRAGRMSLRADVKDFWKEQVMENRLVYLKEKR